MSDLKGQATFAGAGWGQRCEAIAARLASQEGPHVAVSFRHRWKAQDLIASGALDVRHPVRLTPARRAELLHEAEGEDVSHVELTSAEVLELLETLADAEDARDHASSQMVEARAVLQALADRVDPFVFDELSSVLDDLPCDEEGDTIEARLHRAEAALARAREYVAHPGNWSTLDGRRRHILALIDGTAPDSAVALAEVTE